VANVRAESQRCDVQALDSHQRFCV
jgi:hypothetical protein